MYILENGLFFLISLTRNGCYQVTLNKCNVNKLRDNRLSEKRNN